MNWTDDEKEMILKWVGSKYTDDISREFLTEIDKGINSYWKRAESDMTISEYHFSNAVELRNLLNKCIGDDCQDIITPLIAAAIKCRNITEIEESEDPIKDKVTVPEYIYTI